MMSNGSEEDHIEVSLRSEDGLGAVRVEDHVDAGIDEVWSALTDPLRLARWYGEIQGDLRVGGEFHASLFATGWEGIGRIEGCEPGRRLATVSKDPDMPNEDFTEVTLTAQDDRTSLVVEQRGIPLNLLWAYGAGLQIHVEDLAGYLAGRERTDSQPRFEALTPRFQRLAAEIT